MDSENRLTQSFDPAKLHPLDAVLYYLRAAGLSIAQIASLRSMDYRKTYLSVDGQRIDLSEPAARALQDYLQNCRGSMNLQDPLLCALKTSRPLTYKNIHYRLDRLQSQYAHDLDIELIPKIRVQKKDTNILQTEELPSYVRDFLVYMRTVKNMSQKTVSEYYLDLRTFLKFRAVQKGLCTVDRIDDADVSEMPVSEIADVTLSELYEYLNYRREERQNDVRTRMRKVSSLRSFYKFLTRETLIPKNPTLELESPKVGASLPAYLTLDESIRLLQSIDGEYQERNFAIIMLFLNCGMRLSEVVGLNLKDYQGDRFLVHGKGNKERIAYLNDACREAVDAYLAVRGKIRPKANAVNAVFLSRTGTRLSPRMVEMMVAKVMEQAGLDSTKYSPHKLRHTAATLMHQNGVDVRTLQEVLGHENLATTQIYTHVANREVRDAMAKNPLANQQIPKKDENDDI